jgi:hypothetical protein
VAEKVDPAAVGAAGYQFDALRARKSADIPASRSPIILAIEEAGQPILETELLRTERHMTTTLPAERVEELARLADELSADATSVDDVRQAGRRAWEVLTEAQPRLKSVFERVRKADRAQPVAWASRTPLLVRIHKTLLLARSGDHEGPDSLLSTGFGDHYFMPLDLRSSEWGLKRRIGDRARVVIADLREGPEEGWQSKVISASGAEVALLQASNATTMIHDLVEVIKSQKTSPTRVAIGFGKVEFSSDFLEECLLRLPCISVGGPSLAARNLVDSLAEAFPVGAPYQAVSSLLSAFRREWIRQAWETRDTRQLLDGLFWSTWSWVGRPLFANDFGDVGEAAYPHLTDLRSVASPEWYFNRREGIPDCYQANALARPPAEEKDRFHLYLSGAGGTGKSCFLRFVYEQLASRRNVIPVWYRVDAPSSEWELVERRLREEIESSIRGRNGENWEHALPHDFVKLSLYLSELAGNLRAPGYGVDELVIFIDQLERTFESGDEPDFQRLENISNEVIDLLKEVKVGRGVRLFIASRKQYLPDFLHSYDAASRCGLHFNVLQPIGEDKERLGFIRKVMRWCVEQNLVDESVSIDPDAADRLTAQVNGHPLEMMLALIHLLSQGIEGPITREAVDRLRPWEKLFHLDLELARKDRLDWHFLLAMAHARAEIVGFEEVWWRLHLVDSALSTQIEALGPDGVLEWLWLRGHLGRTIHARPEGNDRARFLEFFHANLRDYLLQSVMSWTGKTPDAWRALDRLSAAARDWEHTQQPLDRDDVRALMDHRRSTVEPTGRKNSPERDVFFLLFLRDSENSRPQLCRRAKECFVFSTLVHTDAGLWAFQQIFPDTADQIDCCDRWLRRCPSREHRYWVLRFLVDQNTAEVRRFLADLILAASESAHAERWREISRILAEPLYAARYRTELVMAVLERIGDESAGGSLTLPALPSRLREFLGASCDSRRVELLRLLLDCADRIRGLRTTSLVQLESELRSGEVVNAWLSEAIGTPTSDQMIGTWELEVLARPKLELVVGEDLAGSVNEESVTKWRGELVKRLGMPLPTFELSREPGQVQRHELELRIQGRRIAAEEFYPPRCHVLMRHWERTQTFTPPDVTLGDNELLQEAIVWVDRDYLRQAKWELPMWTAEEAMLDWLEVTLRRSFHDVFDDDLLNAFIQELESRTLDVRGISPQFLRFVIIHFIREAVPVGAHWPELIEELQRGADRQDVLLQNLREHLGTTISESLADEYAELSVIILDEGLERRLIERLISTAEGFELDLAPAEAHALAADIRRHVERNLREHEVMPVVACERSLRLPILQIVERFEPRAKVLSYTELSPELRLVDAGMVRDRLAAAGEAARGPDDVG